ncbi:hypothetical protein SLS62_005984 [Diatrype stigma]|uniref:UBZ4-type domain-containing protein n=1 Tax=Diatrype stigma TaxID=117547 RepID=A0AAN9US25_9PEZI
MATRHTVPRTTEVIPGASVSIVLKADQGTGRQVQGTVRDVLTRGDHHRGIKVRLTDGRIGRVQGLAPSSRGSDATAAYSDGSSNSPAQGELAASTTLVSGPAPERRGQHPRYRDVRLDDDLALPPEQIDLGAYIVPPKRKGKGKKKANAAAQPADPADDGHDLASNSSSVAAGPASTTATCPVCNAFEGDEAAVAHHVTEHFE